MINPKLFIDNCNQLGYKTFTGTTCSYMSDFFDYIANHQSVNFIPAPNEGDAIALATGAALVGQKVITVFQNSGLGNAVNPLSSLSKTYDIPFIGIVSLRGDPNEELIRPDEPQHQLMGKITTELLDLLEIPWQYFPDNDAELKASLIKADELSIAQRTPFFFVLRKDTVQKNSTKAACKDNIKNNQVFLTRYQVLEFLNNYISNTDYVIATTGKTSRELYTIENKPNYFYMVGSMGCALSLGLGLNLGLNNKCLKKQANKIYILDGDGAVLMRMGNMALAGQLQADNIIHILLDNGVHDSTGGQVTNSEQTDFAKVAEGCGYKKIYNITNQEELLETFKQINNTQRNQLTFIRITIKPGSIENLGRPKQHPAELALRFKNNVNKN